MPQQTREDERLGWELLAPERFWARTVRRPLLLASTRLIITLCTGPLQYADGGRRFGSSVCYASAALLCAGGSEPLPGLRHGFPVVVGHHQMSTSCAASFVKRQTAQTAHASALLMPALSSDLFPSLTPKPETMVGACLCAAARSFKLCWAFLDRDLRQKRQCRALVFGWRDNYLVVRQPRPAALR